MLVTRPVGYNSVHTMNSAVQNPLPSPAPNPNSTANQRRPTRELPTPPAPKPIPAVQADGITPPNEWFMQLGWCGNIERVEAESRLKNSARGTYLLRWSDRAKSYVLSYSKPPNFVHVAKIVPKNMGELHVETEENVVVTYKNLLEFVNHTKAKGIITNPVQL